MRQWRAAAMVMMAVVSTACFGLDTLFNKLPTGSSDTPSPDAVRSYLGTWSGPAAAPAAQTCTGTQWRITSQTATQITGDFTAACGAGISLTGTVVGTISDPATTPWAASGNATQGGASCTFNLAGTGAFQGTSNIAVSYSGTACGVAVSATDTIKRS